MSGGDLSNVPLVFERIARENAERVAFRHRRDGVWVPVTWREGWAVVRRVARALVAMGIEPGDRVAILSETRMEWTLADLGIGCCGGVTVGVYPSNLGPDCAYILNHSGARVLFVENAEQAEKVEGVRRDLPHVEKVVIFAGPDNPSTGLLAWDAFLALGNGTDEAEIDRRVGRIGGNDLVSLVYTSGTTGVPKGAMLTHRNLIFVSNSVGASVHLEPHYETLLFLPLAHVFARAIAYVSMRHALPVAFAESFHTVARDLREVRPHFIASVPRLFEKARDRILQTIASAGPFKRAIFSWALEVGTAAAECRRSGSPLPLSLRLRHALANRLALSRVRAGFGGRMRYAISGAAPLDAEIGRFFDACGVLILEGIGMTENTSFSNVNRIESNAFGTVGPAGPGIEVRIAPDGEVLTRGENTMKGYFNDPAATAETIDAEGWLHTGDIGEIDDAGRLRITDRKKDLIVTAGGKNIAPQRIERLLRSSRYIAQAIAHGDRRQFICALVTLDPETVRPWAIAHGLGEIDTQALAAHSRVRELIQSEIDACNEQLASYETVKRFHIVARDFSIEGGELTPTLKLKRKIVVERYRAEIDALYA